MATSRAGYWLWRSQKRACVSFSTWIRCCCMGRAATKSVTACKRSSGRGAVSRRSKGTAAIRTGRLAYRHVDHIPTRESVPCRNQTPYSVCVYFEPHQLRRRRRANGFIGRRRRELKHQRGQRRGQRRIGHAEPHAEIVLDIVK